MLNMNDSSLGGNAVGNIFTDSLYLGCFADMFGLNRILYGYIGMNPHVTGADLIRSCYQQAYAFGATYFGLNYGGYCYYGSTNSVIDRYGPSCALMRMRTV